MKALSALECALRFKARGDEAVKQEMGSLGCFFLGRTIFVGQMR